MRARCLAFNTIRFFPYSSAKKLFLFIYFFFSYCVCFCFEHFFCVCLKCSYIFLSFIRSGKTVFFRFLLLFTVFLCHVSIICPFPCLLIESQSNTCLMIILLISSLYLFLFGLIAFCTYPRGNVVSQTIKINIYKKH